MTELLISSDGNVRAAKVTLPSKKTLNRPLKLLYPIECSNMRDTDSEDKNENMKADMDTKKVSDNVVRPKRQAAQKAELRLKTWAKVLS